MYCGVGRTADTRDGESAHKRGKRQLAVEAVERTENGLMYVGAGD